MSTASVRLDRLRDSVDGRPLVLFGPSDVRWITGFTGSNGWLLVTEDDTTLVTDGRYSEQASDETSRHGCACSIEITRSLSEMVAIIAKRKLPSIVVRPSHVTLDVSHSLEREGVSLEDGEQALAGCRRIKDSAEIHAMSRAAKITDEALHDVVNRIDGRPRERDLRDELEYLMRRLGADGPSYDTIVAAGPDNSARPHHRPTDRRLTDGDALVIDVGALVDGYHSDMTRTFFVGEPPSELERLFRVVSSAQLAGLEAVRAGAEGVAVDAACRRVFEAEGVIDLYPHGTGHGVGLDIHEEPFIGSRCTTSLLAGEVVTVEPGLYRGGIGGIRIEDLVLVTPDGCQILTQYPKEMRCLP
jgi:Xaa-Pro aminopeptidase